MTEKFSLALLNESEFKPDPELRDKVCPNAEILIIVTGEIKPP